jgi:hypothetical protein
MEHGVWRKGQIWYCTFVLLNLIEGMDIGGLVKKQIKSKSFPKLKTDKEAENFVHDADLTEYDFSGFNHEI